jgi:hypothetical protein
MQGLSSASCRPHNSGHPGITTKAPRLREAIPFKDGNIPTADEVGTVDELGDRIALALSTINARVPV